LTNDRAKNLKKEILSEFTAVLGAVVIDALEFEIQSSQGWGPCKDPRCPFETFRPPTYTYLQASYVSQLIHLGRKTFPDQFSFQLVSMVLVVGHLGLTETDSEMNVNVSQTVAGKSNRWG
jgi:hypothetical protein